jgi:hypothetical protein
MVFGFLQVHPAAPIFFRSSAIRRCGLAFGQ